MVSRYYIQDNSISRNRDNRIKDQDSVIKRKSMKVMLLSDSGKLFTSWLPEQAEGRYRFVDMSGIERFPFYIEPKEESWVLYVNSYAYFYELSSFGEEVITGHIKQLDDKSFYYLKYQSETYLIYSEIVNSEDSVYIPYILEQDHEYTIGRASSNDLCYINPTVSRVHARFLWKKNLPEVTDNNSENGIYVNGCRVQSAVLKPGDTIFIMGLYIIIGIGFVMINNANGRISINNSKIQKVTSVNNFYFPEVFLPDNGFLFDRQPRKMASIDRDPINIDSPPTPLSANRIPLLLRLASPALMGGRALMSGNVVMALSSMVIPSLTQGMTEKDRKEYEKKRQTCYREYLEKKTRQIEQEKKAEERLLNQIYPDLEEVLQFVDNGTRLWERRNTDKDFLQVRLGKGRIPLIAEKKYAEKKDFEIEPDVLEQEMYALAEEQVLLDDVPILLHLKDDFVIGMSGIYQKIHELVRNIVLQIAFTHSYDEVKIILLTSQEDVYFYNFIRYLPHNWSDDRSVRFFASNLFDVQQINRFLNNEIENILSNSNRSDAKEGSSYIIFALNKQLFEHLEPIQKLITEKEYKRFSIIAAFEGLPKECRKVINVKKECRIIDYLNSENEEQRFIPDPYNPDLAKKEIQKLVGTKLMLGSETYSLPDVLTFLEMYEVGKVEQLNPLQRWKDNNPVISLAAPVGVGIDGLRFDLDLHEKRQGPHGLVAGMTGSGKSEFLITYILSMAVNYSPDEVAFVLIDYKGGGLADAFENPVRGIHLPHLVGTITNLDGASIQRSLMSVNSELKRRQELFKQTKSEISEGTMDIYDYQKLFRNKKVSVPMPHLFIISDEFAELKAQQPEFMSELISIARIGRSLGVHLILATQKPGGVVTDQIRSNTKFRVCLKVQDRSDSMDMLKRSDAAELKETGRFYLQVGYDEFFAKGQSAWCGAKYIPRAEIKNDNYSIQFIDNTGQTVLNAKPVVKRNKNEIKQIVAIVEYLSDIAKKNDIPLRRLWMDPLPKLLDLDDIKMESGYDRTEMQVLIGKIDDPEQQSQYFFVISMMKFHHLLLCGNAGSGKSTFIRTMLYGLVEQFGPDELHYYIVDLSSGALSSFQKMPHCGAYITDNTENELDRLFDMLNHIIDVRKQIFQEAEVTNYEAYRKSESMPLILVIIDGFTNIKNIKNGNDYFNFLHEYLRDSVNYGIRYIITCNHCNEISSRSKQEIDYRISLQAKDRYEYADILETKCSIVPESTPGRGICLYDGRPLEFQVAIHDSTEDEKTRNIALRERLVEMAAQYKDQKPAEKLPMIDSEQEYSDFCSVFGKERLPLGYYTKDLRQIAIPFQQMYALSLYFGNPAGIKPVLSNIVYGGRFNNADLLIMRRKTDSVFDTDFEKQFLNDYPGNITFLDCSEESLVKLDDFLVEDISARNVYRDEYCRQHGIPDTEKGRAKKAARFIRSNTKALFIIFESFGDFCNLEKDSNMVIELEAFLSRTKGYNIYFFGCFYPNEEGNIGSNPLMKCFNKDELLLLFGGQYDKQCVTNLPMDYRKIDQINPLYDRFVLKYRGNYYTLKMPCGVLNASDGDPEEADII